MTEPKRKMRAEDIRYVGTRVKGEVRVHAVLGIKKRPLKRPNIHSHDGFEWGYGGSGPSDLAYAMLLDVSEDEETAETYHGLFCKAVVASFPREGFEMARTDVVAWLKDVANLTDSQIPEPEFDAFQ